MVNRISQESFLTMLLVQAKYRHGGLFLAMIPKALDAAEIDAAFKELGIDAEKVCEVGNWQATDDGVAVAFLPYPTSN